MTRQIPLTQGFVALVDDEDYDRVVGAGGWHARRDKVTVYASRWVPGDGGRRVALLLHAFITGFDLTDHINGDGLDNRRANLREATKGQNNVNRRRNSNNTSGFKGVGRNAGQWRARIRAGGTELHVGYYPTPEAAAVAYDAAARELHGEFACVNFPRTGERSAR